MTTLETLLSDPDTTGGWNLVADRSVVGFKVKNMWGLIPVKGEFHELSGRGELSSDGAVTGHLEIEVASLRTGIKARDKHLLSADFFDADRYPQIRVVVSALQPTQGKGADLKATFTIKGVTDPVPLPVTITELSDGSVRVCGEAKIDRIQFGVDWNRLGMIAPTVTTTAELIFVRAAQ